MSEKSAFDWGIMSWNVCDRLHRLICPELRSRDGAREYYMNNQQLGREIEETVAALRKSRLGPHTGSPK